MLEQDSCWKWQCRFKAIWLRLYFGDKVKINLMLFVIFMIFSFCLFYQHGVSPACSFVETAWQALSLLAVMIFRNPLSSKFRTHWVHYTNIAGQLSPLHKFRAGQLSPLHKFSRTSPLHKISRTRTLHKFSLVKLMKWQSALVCGRGGYFFINNVLLRIRLSYLYWTS
jgi:hypothetical protein